MIFIVKTLLYNLLLLLINFFLIININSIDYFENNSINKNS